MINQEKLKDKKILKIVFLHSLLEKDIPWSCFFLSVKSKITNNYSMEPQTSPVDPPETVKQLSNKYIHNESDTLQQNVVEFTRSLKE